MNSVTNPAPVNGAASQCTCLNRFDTCAHCRTAPPAPAPAPRRKPKARRAPPAVHALPAVPECWLTAKQAALLLAVGVRTLWRLVEEGRMPQPARLSHKLVRFSKSKLLAWMEQRADDAQPQAG